MNCTVFMYDGEAVGADKARERVLAAAAGELWDEAEVTAIWARMENPAEDHCERLECAETCSRITRERLEILLPDPVT